MESVPVGVRLRDLARAFLKIGAVGFGGPMPMLALVQDEVVVRRCWFSQEEFGEAVMVGQVLPGPAVVNAVTYIGYRLRGLPGAFVSAASFMLPSFLLMLVLTALYLRYGQLPQLSGALRGLGAAVVALIAAAAYRLGKQFVSEWLDLAILLGATLAVLVWQANVILVILFAGLAGLLLRRGPAQGSSRGNTQAGQAGKGTES